jgi:hypothetical protein
MSDLSLIFMKVMLKGLVDYGAHYVQNLRCESYVVKFLFLKEKCT